MQKYKKIVVATRNPAKKERYARLLSAIAETVLDLNDLGVQERPSEYGESAEENAEIKAEFYARITGFPAFSEDEALYVDFLPKEQQPGVHVRRINGIDEVDDNQLVAKWEEMISKNLENKLSGKWHIAYCLATPDGEVKTTALDHPILFFSQTSKIRIPGWPMSSLEGPIKFGKPHSELTNSERRQLDQENDTLTLEKLKELLAK